MADQARKSSRSFLVLSVFCLGALTVLLGLGTWQLQRLNWKNDLISRTAAQARLAPQPLSAVLKSAAEGTDIDYRRIQLSGVYQHNAEANFYSLQDGGPGWRIVTPLKTTDGQTVLVDRGFVPNDSRSPEKRQSGQIAGSVDLIGTVRFEYAPKGSFTPQNNPDKNSWYWFDRPALLKALGTPTSAPFVVQLEQNDHPGKWPEARAMTPYLSNRHLGYALTWFGLAIVLIAVYAALFIKERKAP